MENHMLQKPLRPNVKQLRRLDKYLKNANMIKG